MIFRPKIFIILIFLYPLSFSNILIDKITEKKYKDLMKSIYGENKEITGDYDKTLSITCNNGIFVGKKEDDVISFKGIPFAKPPIGELRWKEPVLAEDSDKVYEAYYFGKSPIQNEHKTQIGSYYPQSEDCLYLNVWMNSKDTSQEKAVLVFIHGGNFRGGATSDPLYDGHNLISKYPDVILVTIEYRLGILGFIDFSIVSGGEDYKNSINLGLLDQICALKWIQKNIKNFGGDPNKVTIFGHSSGGASVLFLTLMDESKGLFKRLISQSGSLAISFSKEDYELITQKLLKKTGAKNMKDLLSLSEKKIAEIYEDLIDYNNYPQRDGNFLPLDLYKDFQSGKGKDIDMILGCTQNETMYWSKTRGEILFNLILPVLYENDLKKISKEDKQYADEFMSLFNDNNLKKLPEFYNEIVFRLPLNKVADYHSDKGGNTYVYLWKYRGEGESLGAYHGIEIPYVFNNFKNTIYSSCIVNDDIINKTQNMWINFARTGNPSTKDLVWDKYDSSNKKIMSIDEEMEIIEGYKDEQKEILDPLLKYYFNGNFGRISYNVPYVYKLVGMFALVLLAIFGMFYLLKH